MPTTTPNYGWSVPVSTDLVKDGATAIELLGDSADATVKALNPETTLGDISYRSATANTNTRLAIGSTGNVLTVAGGVPTWAAPAGGGKVLQVVNVTHDTAASTTSATYADTGLSATITPTLSTSKVLVFVTHSGVGTSNPNLSYGRTRLLRGSTTITQMDTFVAFNAPSTDELYIGSIALNYLDSPATTSATTYKTQFAASGSGAFSVNISAGGNKSVSTITLMEIGA